MNQRIGCLRSSATKLSILAPLWTPRMSVSRVVSAARFLLVPMLGVYTDEVTSLVAAVEGIRPDDEPGVALPPNPSEPAGELDLTPVLTPDEPNDVDTVVFVLDPDRLDEGVDVLHAFRPNRLPDEEVDVFCLPDMGRLDEEADVLPVVDPKGIDEEVDVFSVLALNAPDEEDAVVVVLILKELGDVATVVGAAELEIRGASGLVDASFPKLELKPKDITYIGCDRGSKSKSKSNASSQMK